MNNKNSKVTEISLGKAQIRLIDLIRQLLPGEEIIITENEQPVAKLVKPQVKERPGPGVCKGMITNIAEDFDATPEGMEEYTEADFLLTESQQQDLQQRIEKYDTNPKAGSSWEEVKKRLRETS